MQLRWRLLGSASLLVLLLIGAVIAQPTAVPRVGLVTDVGKINDGTFNELAYRGMMRAVADFKLQSAFIETQQPTDYEKNIAQLITTGHGMIITVGFMLGEATQKMATKHPQVRFTIVDFAYETALPNVVSLLFAEEQAGFLAGALAGLMTRNNMAGMVAGMALPPVVRFRRGYDAGVRYVCEPCEVLGVYIDSFTDPARGKTAALSQIDEGADVVFGGGGTTGSGAILGAAQAGAWVIGVDQDEYITTFKQGTVRGANRLLSSAMKRVDNAVYGAIQRAVAGTFTGGTQVFNASNDGIGLAPFHEAEAEVPPAVQARLQEIAGGLKSGAITVQPEAK